MPQEEDFNIEEVLKLANEVASPDWLGMELAECYVDERNLSPVPPKTTKYRAKKIVMDGYTFDSIKECGDYIDAKRRQDVEEIRNLKVHPKYRIDVQSVYICTYVADISYEEAYTSIETGITGITRWFPIVQDSKGVKTPAYNLKKKLMKAVYGIDIKEV